jgi:hypothetical protein
MPKSQYKKPGKKKTKGKWTIDRGKGKKTMKPYPKKGK